MAYFSNSTEGLAYEDQYCDHCIHQHQDDGGCMVMFIHSLYNYQECNKKDSILHILIPRDKSGNNLECSMFHASGQGNRGAVNFAVDDWHQHLDKINETNT